MNSYSLIIESLWWIHMRHFMTYEFIYDFMYVKNIVKSYLKSCVPRFQMSSLACCPVKHLLLNNFFYLATWSTSCSFTYFEISCQFCQTKCQLLNWLIFQVHILQTKCQLLYQLLGQLLDATECMAMQQWHYLAQLSSTVMSNMRWNTRTCLAQFAVHLVASPLHPSEHFISRPWHQHLPCIGLQWYSWTHCSGRRAGSGKKTCHPGPCHFHHIGHSSLSLQQRPLPGSAQIIWRFFEELPVTSQMTTPLWHTHIMAGKSA